MNKKLYYHKTDGGAEYLCTAPIKGTKEGDLFTAIIRLDGEPELLSLVFSPIPELLEACEAFVTAWDKCLQLEKTDTALRLARAAIAQAKGE